jgi:hypothetical protein
MISPQEIRAKYTKPGIAAKFFDDLIFPQVETCLKRGSTPLADQVCAVFESHWETNDDCFEYIHNDARVFHELCVLAEQAHKKCISSFEPIEVFDWAMKRLIQIYCHDIEKSIVLTV